MSDTADRLTRLARARDLVERSLLAERTEAGYWVGELSTSALSTATASLALMVVDSARRETGDPGAAHDRLINAGLDWLAAHANHDGGWGDTTRSVSNLSTTTLCWAALSAAAAHRERYARAIATAERWIADKAPGLEPASLAAAIAAVYGRDRTFSIPILTHCALAGRLGEGAAAWSLVAQLPFELAACPRSWFKRLGLPVVSYALPALIAVGQVRHHHLPSRNPLWRFLRNRTMERTLDTLTDIQPSSGGFLEAVPLTSFVTMSLAGCGRANHPVAHEAVRFLARAVRPDGSWPIDTNLATWVTTLSVDALAAGRVSGGVPLPAPARDRLRAWLLEQQYSVVHPYTGAAPGGWAWTDLPGGVPDADDTPGALLALRRLGLAGSRCLEAGRAGVRWLLDLQNRDGGMPTFCRGWSRLPFDRSGADLTAHALRAWHEWQNDLPDLSERIDRALWRGIDYLRRTQRSDGSWVPLWFGNQHAPNSENPVYGTAKVLSALEVVGAARARAARRALERGRSWLLAAQDPDGGWGGAPGTPPSFEETALAVHALASAATAPSPPPRQAEPLARGVDWLLERLDDGRLPEASPIGFYFARLWYFERLYPHIFALAALNRAQAHLTVTDGAAL